jgi:hypothetical protein
MNIFDLNWWGMLAAMVATWCGVDIGIAIKEKNTKEIIFNSVIIFFELCYILFSWGVS